jgi:AcrR family transcriptional regulator
LTTRRVAAEAGVNLGLLHYHFASKEALVRETLQTFIGELMASVATASQAFPGAGPEATLAEIFTLALDRVMARPGLAFGLIGQLVNIMATASGPGSNEAMEDTLAKHESLGFLLEAQTFLVQRIKSLLAPSLGKDEALLSRKSLQLFTSLFHPLLFTPFPLMIYGLDLERPEGRRAYVEGVIADALKP